MCFLITLQFLYHLSQKCWQFLLNHPVSLLVCEDGNCVHLFQHHAPRHPTLCPITISCSINNYWINGQMNKEDFPSHCSIVAEKPGKYLIFQHGGIRSMKCDLWHVELSMTVIRNIMIKIFNDIWKGVSRIQLGKTTALYLWMYSLVVFLLSGF